jgi:nicotinate-nucleotide adenylyltransferase
MLKTLCLGGSFNPIHHGHLICARAAAESSGFDRILLIPSSQPPHKPADPNMADASHRLKMAQAAVAQSELFEVDGLEIARAGLSYTLDTVRALKRKGIEEVNWLIGADLLPQFQTWHEPVALLAEAVFWVVLRPGFEINWPALPPPLRDLRERVLVAPSIDISATDIRRRVSQGQSIDFLTPPPVVTYIKQNGLYGWNGPRPRASEKLG